MRRGSSVFGIVIGAILIVVALFAFVLNKNDKMDKTTNTTNQQATTNTPAPAPSPSSGVDNSTAGNTEPNQAAETTIMYSDQGFNPKELTVKAGTTLTITNNSSQALQFNSGPHPIHTANSELNVGAVAMGESKTFTVTNKGTWSFHNHLQDDDMGTLIVE